jgi:holo-[acyl-carrier-protein] synthase
MPEERPCPVVSFSDESDLRIAAAAQSPGLIGLGVDMLDVGRLARYARDAAARHHFERRICSPDELQAQVTHPELPLHVELAVRFSIKEAVSKALGTGLRLGLGLGAGHGLPMAAITVLMDTQTARVVLHGRAYARLRRIGAQRLEARWAYHDPFAVALALLWR